MNPFRPALLFSLVVVTSSSLASAQDIPAAPSSGLTYPSNVVVLPPPESPRPHVTVGGYVEGYYSYNFANPTPGLNLARGFDSRHNNFSLHNAAIRVDANHDGVYARVTVQAGEATNQVYGGLGPLAGGGLGGLGSGDTLRHLQEGFAGVKLTRWLEADAGVFLSPVGIETYAVKDSWNFSRSNLFVGLPIYHAGARLRILPSDRWTLTASVVNGWNNTSDNNADKSFFVAAKYESPGFFRGQLLYFGGVETTKWRQFVDLSAEITPGRFVAFAAHVNGGMQPDNGAMWLGAAGYVKVMPLRWLHVTARQDWLGANDVNEQSPQPGGLGAVGLLGRGSPVGLVAIDGLMSSTLTLDFRPREAFSFRLEGRHDRSLGAAIFNPRVEGDTPAGGTPRLTLDTFQTTLTAGVVAAF